MSGSFMAENTMTFDSGFTCVSWRQTSTAAAGPGDRHGEVVDMGQVEVDHNHVGLESLRGCQYCAAVRDGSYDFAVQCERPSNGFRHGRVIFGYQHARSLGQDGPPARDVMPQPTGRAGSSVLRCGGG